VILDRQACGSHGHHRTHSRTVADFNAAPPFNLVMMITLPGLLRHAISTIRIESTARAFQWLRKKRCPDGVVRGTCRSLYLVCSKTNLRAWCRPLRSLQPTRNTRRRRPIDMRATPAVACVTTFESN